MPSFRNNENSYVELQIPDKEGCELVFGNFLNSEITRFVLMD